MNLIFALFLVVNSLLPDVESKVEKSPVVHLKGGDVLGSIEESENGRKFYAFQGIPFVKPPGRLEYAEPGENLWQGVLNATGPGVACAQSGYGVITGEEDCLHLTVYTPKHPDESDSQAMPVLVWLHGGAFVSGSAADYSPHLLMDRDMVVVIPQYRLGILGFFSYHSINASGNYAMIDQVMALKWVQENIAAFGGDRDRVTLGGDCAGGSSAMYHMLSPLSKGLFKRVIAFSGTALNPWAIYRKHDKFVLIFCKLEKCPPGNGPRLRKWLIERSNIDDILLNQRDVQVFNDPFIGNYHLAPGLQTHRMEVSKEHWFLKDLPVKSLLREKFTKVPVMLGITRDIGSYIVDWEFYSYYLHDIERRNVEWAEERVMRVFLTSAEILYKNTSDFFRKYYMPKWNKRTKFLDCLADVKEMLGDIFYRGGIMASAKLLSEHVPTYFINFGYEGGPKLFDMRHPDPEKQPPGLEPGVSHGDDLFFFLPYERVEMNEEQKKISKVMVDIIENYVYEREPLEKWPTFTKEGLETLFITQEGDIEMGKPFVDESKKQVLEFIFYEQNKYFHDYYGDIMPKKYMQMIETEKPKLRKKREEL